MPKAIEGAHDAVLAAARKLLARDGYQRLSMRAIAAESGLGIGTIYNYYAAKDEIVFALMLGDWRESLCSMDDIVADRRGAEDSLKGIFAQLHGFTSRYAMVWRLMSAAPTESRSPSIREYSTSAFVAELESRIGAVLDRTIQPGEAPSLAALIAKVFSLFAMEGVPDHASIEHLLLRLLPSQAS